MSKARRRPPMRTQVAIIGAGPAGLLLGHLLDREGIASIIIERHNRLYVEDRVRAGVLEQTTVDLLIEAGMGRRLQREGLVHRGIELAFAGRRHRIDFAGLTGRCVTVYGQQEVVKDLIAARLAAGAPLLFEAEALRLDDVDTKRPAAIIRAAGEERRIEADFIAGCDGSHGVCRESIPEAARCSYEKAYPFAWLGILAEAGPVREELLYSRHERGFALFSMRSPQITRLYLQCDPEEDLRTWPDGRIWEELHARLEVGGDFKLNEGSVLQKGVTTMRSFVIEPMQFGRLYLAGDAAHIVPPTGAKGMNLAVADISYLAQALIAFYRRGSEDELRAYSRRCLARVWRTQRFSAWMTNLLHLAPGRSPFDDRVQLAELESLARSRAASAALAENYVGLPLE